MLKDDLIIRLDQFSNEMVILREEIKSLQTVKASLQKRINELEDDARKHREEMAERAKKAEEEEVSFGIPRFLTLEFYSIFLLAAHLSLV